nr:CBN-ATM-1 protein [Haemonchus contortus]
MFPNGSALTEDHALNGLPQLGKLVRGILEKSIKKVSERDAAIRDIVTIVSNCTSFYISGADTNIYPLSTLISDLCALALLEVKENGEKLGKNRVSCKTTCFELAINVLNKLCDRQLLSEDCAVFLDFIFIIIHEPFVNSQIWVEDEISNVLAKFVVPSSSSIIDAHFQKLWSLVWYRFSFVVLSNGRSSCNYLRIAVVLLKNLHKTSMISGDSGQKLITDLIEKLFTAIKKKDINKWNSQIVFALDLLSLLIDEWGIECRDSLLVHCLPLAEAIVEMLDFSSSTSSDLDVTWRFFDRLFHLAVPDCRPSCLVPNEAYCLAQSACDVLRRALLSLTLSRVDYDLKHEYVPLFTRILLIADYTPASDLDASMASYTQRSKRRRKLDCLDVSFVLR